MAINNVIGDPSQRQSGASLIVNSLKNAMDQQKQQKLAMAMEMIKNGSYQPVPQSQAPQTPMLQNIMQGLTGPSIGGPNMNVMGQNFQMQTPQTKMANLQEQLQAIQGMNQGGQGSQTSSPMVNGVASGLPGKLPTYSVTPGDIDFSKGTVDPKVTMNTPLQQADYQDKLIDIENKQQAQKENQDSQQYAGMQPEDIQKQIQQKNPTEAAILKKLANGDMTLKDLPVRNPAMVKKITGDLAVAYPGFDEQKIAARRKTKIDFAPGGSIGKQATTAGTMIQHMYELRKTIDELGDTGFKPFNQMVQSGKRMFGPGSAPLKKYDTIKNAIAGEWDKYLRAGGSAEAGIDRILQGMDEADTPEAQKSALDEMANLMAGRMGQYVDEWGASFDQPGDPKIPSYVMSTRTRYALNKMGLDDVIKGVENPEGSAKVDEDKAQAQSGGQSYAVGQVIPMGNKKYRVTGGDPKDPDIEEVK
jgi:hypothetical protein